MGLLGDIGNWIKDKIFGGSDKAKAAKIEQETQIRVAEIERDRQFGMADRERARIITESDARINAQNVEAANQIALKRADAEIQMRLADKETERVELAKNAQLEIIEAQKIAQMAIEEARVKGMAAMSEQIVILQEKMLDVAKNRIAIIEECSLPIIHDIENFYSEVNARITANREEYNTKKFPQLLSMLEQYEEGTTAHKLYAKQIELDQIQQAKFIETQLQQVIERQNFVLQSFVSAKSQILEQTGQITKSIAESSLKKFEQALPPPLSTGNLQLSPPAPKQLPPA